MCERILSHILSRSGGVVIGCLSFRLLNVVRVWDGPYFLTW